MGKLGSPVDACVLHISERRFPIRDRLREIGWMGDKAIIRRVVENIREKQQYRRLVYAASVDRMQYAKRNV